MIKPSKDSFSTRRIILCEGSGDASFLRKLIEVRNLPRCDVVYPRMDVDPGGRSGFASRLESLVFGEGFAGVRGILLVTDSDADPECSLKETRHGIKRAGFKAPNVADKPARQKDGFPPIAIHMIPGPEASGNLETICLAAMERRWPEHWVCVQALMNCGHTTDWTEGKRAKSALRVMLATTCKADPNTSLTWAWSENRGDLIPITDPCFDSVALAIESFDLMFESANLD